MKGLLEPISRAPAACFEDSGALKDWCVSEMRFRDALKLPGDASARRYYRLVQDTSRSFILMKAEPFADLGRDWPFLAVREHLASRGVPVPTVLEIDPARGLLLLEDLGDTTLLRRLQSVDAQSTERALYERAIAILVDLQSKASLPPNGTRLDAFKLRFDVEKLMWEVGFTIEHFYEKHLARNILPSDRSAMISGFRRICERLAAIPTVLAHRDYHSRNIMVTEGESRFVMIDFQDARMGPPQYDLASLLRDSYYQLEEAQIARLTGYYLDRWSDATGSRPERQEFEELLDLMAVQRGFKAIGSFASFLNRRGNATYLKYIGNTFENIRRILLKYPTYRDLREALYHYYYF